MKTTTALATVFAFLGLGINSVSAGCYSGGAEWRNRDAARFHVERACRGYDGKQGAMQGVFGPGQSKSFCITDSDQRLDFTIQNLNNGASFDLNDEDCVHGLEDEINACLNGGESIKSGWRFR